MEGSIEVWGLLSGGSAVTQGVLLLLFLLSVSTWAVVGGKTIELRRTRVQSARLEGLLASGASLAQLHRHAGHLPASPLAALFRAGYERTASGPVDAGVMGALLQAVGAEEMGRLERHMSLLATAASVSPFVGLLGTVWGIMVAFNSIGLRGSASLAVVAPGIAEALVATAAGLAVAIPAVVAYNVFVSRLDRVQRQLERFAAELTLRLGADAK